MQIDITQEKYSYASNKKKLLRAIAFVDAGNQNPNITQEQKDKMVKEYYIQVGGLVIGSSITATINTENSTMSQEQLDNLGFKCDKCDYVAKKEAGLAIHKGREHKIDENIESAK